MQCTIVLNTPRDFIGPQGREFGKHALTPLQDLPFVPRLGELVTLLEEDKVTSITYEVVRVQHMGSRAGGLLGVFVFVEKRDV